MRILLTTHYGTPHVGGIETAVDGLRTALGRRGHEVIHLTSDVVGGPDAQRSAGNGMRRVPAWNGLESRGVPWPIFGRQLGRTLDELLAWADVAHAHGLLYMPSLALALRRRRPLRTRLVVTEHVGHVKYANRLVDGLERAAIRTVGAITAQRADALVALNERVASELHQLAPEQPVQIIANGIDTEAFRPASTAERAAARSSLGWDERPRVLFVGRLVEKKGLPTLMRLADRLGDDGDLVLVGPGRIPPSRAVHLGPVCRDEVRRLLHAADVMVLPSRGEGFPVSAQEALSSGMPVVMTNDPSYKTLGSSARGGLRLGDDVDQLESHIRDILLGDRGAASADARHLAETHFNWDVACAAYEKCYRGTEA